MAETGEACLIIGLIAVVILAFIGIFVGIFLGSILIQRIMQKHLRVLWLREETKKYVVVDFDGQAFPVRGPQPQPSAPQAIPEVEEDRPLLARQASYPDGLHA